MLLWEQEIYCPFSLNRISDTWYYFAGDVSLYLAVELYVLTDCLIILYLIF
jgi:hypothetical protein